MLAWVLSKLRTSEPERRRLLLLAEIARKEGALEQARQHCRSILRRSPDDAGALSLMAAMAADANQIEEGLPWAQRAIAADPQAVAPHYALGRLLELAGRLIEAESSYRKVIDLDPVHARAHNNLGCVLHMQGKLDAALVCYRKALELDPSQPEANQNYAAIVRDASSHELAIEGYLRQTRENPDDAVAFNNLANTYVESGRHQEALASFERAIALDPDRPEAHFSRSFVLVLCGDYLEGWKEYEWRWRINAFNAPARRFPQPMWDGSRIADGMVLIHAEQGFGDMLQFVRYAPLVAERCAAVVLECLPQLKSLLKGVNGVRQVVAKGEALPQFAAHLPLMSLPRVFGTTIESIPWQGPYIRADPKHIAEWGLLIESDGTARLKVGLAWAGNPQNWDDRKRSISLNMLAPLARAAGVTFFSLQVGGAAAEAAAPPPGMKLIDHTARIRDFSDTAALMSHLDLVITIDTSVAHLAGAMGVPTWVVLACAADFRYHLVRSDNPWYPSMRLFRQERDGDWTGAIERVAEALFRRTDSSRPA
jgi:tetratricopeptide (TPR) repeat protein